jgi:hypothetical protein
MPWYAVRTVYHFDTKSDGKNVFEERIVSFNASGWEEAHTKAEAEADAYANERHVVAHPEHSGYEQDGQPLIDGFELWSELFEAFQSLEEFYADRYARYEYHPD